MNIRQTRQEDLAEVMAMYDYARRFMQEHGNGNQRTNGDASDLLQSEDGIRGAHESRELGHVYMVQIFSSPVVLPLH